MSAAAHNNNHATTEFEFKYSLLAYLAMLISGLVFGSMFLYFSVFPARPDLFWGRFLLLGLALWIYYTVFFAPLKLRVTSEGIEAKGILSKCFLQWDEIQKIQLGEAYTFGGGSAPGVPIYNSVNLTITGLKSKLRFGFGPPWGRRCKEDLPLLLSIIQERTGKSPEE